MCLKIKLDFQLRKRKSRIVQPITVTDIVFADDIAFISEGIKEAHEMQVTNEVLYGAIDKVSTKIRRCH